MSMNEAPKKCERNKDPIPSPISTFYLTEGCNLACRHCWIAPTFQAGEKTYPSLDVDLFRSIISQAKTLGLGGVKLTGGEPLLHPRIGELIEIRQGREPASHHGDERGPLHPGTRPPHCLLQEHLRFGEPRRGRQRDARVDAGGGRLLFSGPAGYQELRRCRHPSPGDHEHRPAEPGADGARGPPCRDCRCQFGQVQPRAAHGSGRTHA